MRSLMLNEVLQVSGGEYFVSELNGYMSGYISADLVKLLKEEAHYDALKPVVAMCIGIILLTATPLLSVGAAAFGMATLVLGVSAYSYQYHAYPSWPQNTQ